MLPNFSTSPPLYGWVVVHERYGTKEYWIVNPQEKSVAVFVKAKEDRFDISSIFFHPAIIKSSFFSDFEISTDEIFAKI